LRKTTHTSGAKAAARLMKANRDSMWIIRLKNQGTRAKRFLRRELLSRLKRLFTLEAGVKQPLDERRRWKLPS